MRLLIASSLFFIILACAPHTKQGAVPEHYNALSYPEFQYESPKPQEYRTVLSNGVPVYMVVQKDLPLTNVNFTFKELNFSESRKKSVAVELLSSMYRKGGTAELSADSIDEYLESISAGLSGGLSNYSSSIQLDVVSNDVYDVLKLGREMFLTPGIDSIRLEQLKSNYVQNIRHQYDHPASVSQTLYDHVMYGKHPVNWDITEDDVVEVTRAAILGEAGGRFNLENLVLGVAGDFDKDSMVQFLETYFKEWNNGTKAKSGVEEPAAIAQPGVYIVDKDVSQAHIRMGQAFVKRPHADYYPATVASYILGSGGFTSRLVAKVRTDEGLAYTVRSWVGSNYDYQASAGIALQTKVSTAAYAVKLCLNEIERMISDGISDAELQRAQDYFIQSIPSIFKTPENTVDYFVMSESNGRDFDHMDQYIAKIKAVTKEDVQRVVARYFNPGQMAITIVGPKDDLIKRDEEHNISLEEMGSISFLKVEELLVKD